MEQWWLLGKDRRPIGPVSQKLVLQGILAGRVPGDSLVCEVGGSAWRPIRELDPFTRAFAKLRIDGPTIVDPPLDAQPLSRVRHEDNDRTVADAGPVTESPPRPSSPALQRFEEALGESTIADATYVERTIVDKTVVDSAMSEEPFPLRERR
jgi:hypothetical protein